MSEDVHSQGRFLGGVALVLAVLAVAFAAFVLIAGFTGG